MTQAKILIVEDESIIAMELEDQLSQLGYLVVGTASNSNAAIQQSELTQPDVVLMDIRITGEKDGIETAAIIRSRFDIPVIYLTAYADEATVRRAKQTAPFGYLLKPLREYELQAAIEVALHKHGMENALKQQRAEFLAMLTHDINNPLGVVQGYADMLAEELKTHGFTQGEDLLNRLQSNLLTIRSLVANYPLLLTIEANDLQVSMKPLALNDILVLVERQYAPEAERRGLRLETSLAKDLPAVIGNALMLERVFANLVYNALKFTPQRGEVTLRSFRRDHIAAASVTDTGVGFSPEEKSLIFEKHWRKKEGQSQAGNGLGLYIVKSLVEAHGGRVEVESTPGAGSCFTVLLPTDGKIE